MRTENTSEVGDHGVIADDGVGLAVGDGGGDVGGRMAALFGELKQLEDGAVWVGSDELEGAVGLCGELGVWMDGWKCRLALQLVSLGPDVDAAEILRRGFRVGGRDARRLVKTARRLVELPRVAEMFRSGVITLGHVHALVAAADRVGPQTVEAAEGLLEAAIQMAPDRFWRESREWANRTLIEAGVDLLERQRLAREARMWTEGGTGLGVIHAKLPAPVFAHIRQAADKRYLELVREDSSGGRDPDSVRTPAQRMADVISELLTDLDPYTGEPTGQGTTRVKGSTQVVVTVRSDVVVGTNPTPEEGDDDGGDDGGSGVELIGVGPVPRSILANLSADSELAGMIYDRAGRVLWLGRNQRLANVAQRLAVAVRDGGCFECGAPMHRCELHHVKPWARGGRTDIDNLVAVCRTHHQWIETHDLTIRRVNGRWVAQPRDAPDPPEP